MYRFNLVDTQGDLDSILFKYNPCIGSISKRVEHHWVYSEFKYNPCIGSMSIVAIQAPTLKAFKYNPCIGSIITRS